MYVFGGNGEGGECLDELWRLDCEEYEWVKCEQHGRIPCGRERHTLTAVNAELVMFGGWSGRRSLDDIYVLDTETNTWSTPLLHTHHAHPIQVRAYMRAGQGCNESLAAGKGWALCYI